MAGETAPRLHATGYDRSACRTGIVHLGYGAFHRAHQAVYIDDYMEATGDLAWGIAAVNLRREESAAFAAAREAAEGYLLKTTSPEGEVTWRLVRSHLAFADWSQDAAAAEALLARPEVRAVTMTVTESGYALGDDRALDTRHPAIAAELAGGPPRSVYGYLAAALSRRIEAGAGPLTLMCCDNIRSNGHMLEANLTAYCRALGREDIADWLAAHAAFPCSMVDRITPRAGEALLAEAGRLFPGRALAPIHAEAFIQWVLERRFAGPMPDLARAGVEVVDDVDPYEEAKIRILNGGHTGLAYLGALAGHRTFDQAMADPRLRAHFDAWERDCVLPGLTIALPFDKERYLESIAARFSNVAIADQLERICMDGFAKMPIYILPTIESCLDLGRDPVPGYDCVASWVVYARRVAAGTARVPYHDPYWPVLEPLLAPGREADLARLPQLWGDMPARHPRFVEGVRAAIGRMEHDWPA
jgi:D-arabinitol 4-dehydrogenase